MDLEKNNTSLFKRLRFILVEASSPGNVGSAARAIKNMGFSDLALVNPRSHDVLHSREAVAFSSNARDILSKARVFSSVEQALEGYNFSAALSARLRKFPLPLTTPRGWAAQIFKNSDLKPAIIFGSERYGLPNKIVEKCNIMVSIPADPGYCSLNLAQAVQVMAYECRVAATVSNPDFQTEAGESSIASLDSVEKMLSHLERALISIQFLDPLRPKKLMPRLRKLFLRAQLEKEEISIMRGISRKILDSTKE